MPTKRSLLLLTMAIGVAIVAAACGDSHSAPVATGDAADHDQSDDPHATESSDDDHNTADSHSAGDTPTAAEGQFPTVGFEESYTTTVDFAPDDVCPLFEPSGRFLLYDDWDDVVLREPQGDTLQGRVSSSQSFGLDVLVIVTDHRPDDGVLEYVALWDDFEVQRITITCVEGDSPDSTSVTWDERNAGLHEEGVPLVTQFIEAGAVQTLVENYAANVAAYLQNQ